LVTEAHGLMAVAETGSARAASPRPPTGQE